MKNIIINVKGGVVQSVHNVPVGVEVQVNDFDIDGVEDKMLSTLKNGEKCLVGLWDNKNCSAGGDQYEEG